MAITYSGYGVTLTSEQIADFAYGAGFRDSALVTAVAIAMAESGGKVDAVGDIALQNATWGPSVGLWQIRSLKADKGTRRNRDELALYDPVFNAKAAYSISGGGRNWSPWSVYTKGTYQAHMPKANQAASSVKGRGGPAGSVTNVVGDISYPVPPPSELSIDPVEPRKPSSIVIRGNDLSLLVGDVVVDGDVDMTSSDICEISIDCPDSELAIWGAAWLSQGTPVDWDGWKLEVTRKSVRRQGYIWYTKIHFWPRGIATLCTRQGQTRNNTSVGEYIAAEVADLGLEVVNYEPQGLRRDIVPGEQTATLGPSLSTDEYQEPEYCWGTFQRLAKEDGCWLFALPESQIVYGKPSIIVRAMPYLDIGVNGSVKNDSAYDFMDLMADFTVDRNSPNVVNKLINVKLPRRRGERVRPGMAARFPGFPGLDQDNKYIITKTSWRLNDYNSDVDLDVEIPVDPVAQPINSGGLGPLIESIGQSTTGIAKGTKSSLDFVAFALGQAGDKYVYGATPNASDPNPANFDCSSLVQWAAAQVGVSLPRTSDAQLNACKPISIAEAMNTRGALIGRRGTGANGHVVISLGDGRTIEARGERYGVVVGSAEGRGFDAAGLIRDMNYGPKNPVYGPFATGSINPNTGQVVAPRTPIYGPFAPGTVNPNTGQVIGAW